MAVAAMRAADLHIRSSLGHLHAGSASEPQSDPAEEKYCFNVCTFATDVLKLAELIKQKLI